MKETNPYIYNKISKVNSLRARELISLSLYQRTCCCKRVETRPAITRSQRGHIIQEQCDISKRLFARYFRKVLGMGPYTTKGTYTRTCTKVERRSPRPKLLHERLPAGPVALITNSVPRAHPFSRENIAPLPFPFHSPLLCPLYTYLHYFLSLSLLFVSYHHDRRVVKFPCNPKNRLLTTRYE